MTSHGFTVESSRVVYEGAVVTDQILSVRTPDGDLVERQALRHPGAVAVVAIHDGCVVLVEQYRAPIDDTLIEIPAGKLDIPGEDLDTAARRELVEEVGLEAGEMHLLGDYFTAAGFCDELITVFAATECVQVDRQVDGVEEAHSAILRVPTSEIDAWLGDGRLRDSKSLIGLNWARNRGLLDPDR